MTGHDPYAPATPLSGAVPPLPASGEETTDDQAETPASAPVVAIPRDATVVVDPDMVGVLLVPRHLFLPDDVARGDVVVLHDAEADTDDYDTHARVVGVTDGVVRLQPFDPDDETAEFTFEEVPAETHDGGTGGDDAGSHDHDETDTDDATGSEADAMTGDGAPKDDHELTKEGTPSGPGPSGVEVQGALVASPDGDPSAPQGDGDGRPAPSATETPAGDPGGTGPARTYDDGDVPENATAVVAWLDTAEDDADQRARAVVARRVENLRAEKDRRVTVERAVADVLDA